ncbi:unnamed protein product [Vitrella brassicaformis CCMP3155]|uniref:Uncharacterized protein n=3 Tax=Vitrella brassicaformis TaxID=1169539 RepID=A0A0G4EN00_VITBC|nr:unnamed protein product [Vitrella brassicaformis CCMP3155]|eukprot:CEL98195.1 unnamed protein product [Vitrella brassicaformis CCMP3155]
MDEGKESLKEDIQNASSVDDLLRALQSWGPQQAIDESLQPAALLLDELGIDRHEQYKDVFQRLQQEFAQRSHRMTTSRDRTQQSERFLRQPFPSSSSSREISTSAPVDRFAMDRGQKDGVALTAAWPARQSEENDAKMLAVLRESLPFIGDHHLKSVPLKLLEALPVLPPDVLEGCADRLREANNKAVFPTSVTRQVWASCPELFESALGPRVEKLIKHLHEDAASSPIDRSQDRTAWRKSLPELKEIVEMIGDRVELYDMCVAMLLRSFCHSATRQPTSASEPHKHHHHRHHHGHHHHHHHHASSSSHKRKERHSGKHLSPPLPPFPQLKSSGDNDDVVMMDGRSPRSRKRKAPSSHQPFVSSAFSRPEPYLSTVRNLLVLALHDAHAHKRGTASLDLQGEDAPHHTTPHHTTHLYLRHLVFLLQCPSIYPSVHPAAEPLFDLIWQLEAIRNRTLTAKGEGGLQHCLANTKTEDPTVVFDVSFILADPHQLISLINELERDGAWEMQSLADSSSKEGAHSKSVILQLFALGLMCVPIYHKNQSEITSSLRPHQHRPKPVVRSAKDVWAGNHSHASHTSHGSHPTSPRKRERRHAVSLLQCVSYPMEDIPMYVAPPPATTTRRARGDTRTDTDVVLGADTDVGMGRAGRRGLGAGTGSPSSPAPPPPLYMDEDDEATLEEWLPLLDRTAIVKPLSKYRRFMQLLAQSRRKTAAAAAAAAQQQQHPPSASSTSLSHPTDVHSPFTKVTSPMSAMPARVRPSFPPPLLPPLAPAAAPPAADKDTERQDTQHAGGQLKAATATSSAVRPSLSAALNEFVEAIRQGSREASMMATAEDELDDDESCVALVYSRRVLHRLLSSLVLVRGVQQARWLREVGEVLIQSFQHEALTQEGLPEGWTSLFVMECIQFAVTQMIQVSAPPSGRSGLGLRLSTSLWTLLHDKLMLPLAAQWRSFRTIRHMSKAMVRVLFTAKQRALQPTPAPPQPPPQQQRRSPTAEVGADSDAAPTSSSPRQGSTPDERRERADREVGEWLDTLAKTAASLWFAKKPKESTKMPRDAEDICKVVGEVWTASQHATFRGEVVQRFSVLIQQTKGGGAVEGQ